MIIIQSVLVSRVQSVLTTRSSHASSNLRLAGAEGSVRKGKPVTVYQTVYGDSHLRQRHCSLDFMIGPATFYQTNRALVETLCQAVVSSAGVQS